MVIRDDFEPSLSDSVCSLLAHICAAHIPLRLHQWLHDVLGTTDRVDTQQVLRMILNRIKKL